MNLSMWADRENRRDSCKEAREEPAVILEADEGPRVQKPGMTLSTPTQSGKMPTAARVAMVPDVQDSPGMDIVN